MTRTPTGAPPPAGAAGTPGWAEAAARLRAAALTAAMTEPGRLRVMGAGLALLAVLFGAVAAGQVAERAAAARDVATRSEPLSATAAEIYRSLADANTTESGGFLTNGQEPVAVTDRYQDDIRTAARLIAAAAASGQTTTQAKAPITTLSEELPVYTGLVETARADNRQGFPLGGAYLRYASDQMTGVLLPAAQRLHTLEQRRLGGDYADARALPWAAWVLGVLTLAALVWAQRRLYRRTNRVFNRGLLAASAACVAALLWLVVGPTVARADLDDSVTHGAASLRVLEAARIDGLKARGDENLTLVARGAGQQYEQEYQREMAGLAGAPGSGGGLLAQALADADTAAGREPVRAAIAGAGQWRARHAVENDQDDRGDYVTAVAEVIGGRDAAGRTVTATTGRSFDAVDAGLGRAIASETGELQHAVAGARGALAALPEAAAALGLLGAGCAVAGVGRRLAEFR